MPTVLLCVVAHRITVQFDFLITNSLQHPKYEQFIHDKSTLVSSSAKVAALWDIWPPLYSGRNILCFCGAPLHYNYFGYILQRACVGPWVVYVTVWNGPSHFKRLTLSKCIPWEVAGVGRVSRECRFGSPHGPSGWIRTEGSVLTFATTITQIPTFQTGNAT